MKPRAVTIVRVYLTEGEDLIKRIRAKLHDEEKVRGVTVFRGVSGFGRSGKLHSASLLDLSLDLPLVIEFFDEPAKAERIVQHLAALIPPGHIVSWSAHVQED